MPPGGRSSVDGRICGAFVLVAAAPPTRDRGHGFGGARRHRGGGFGRCAAARCGRVGAGAAFGPGVDMALALVEEDHGAELRALAKHLIVFRCRHRSSIPVQRRQQHRHAVRARTAPGGRRRGRGSGGRPRSCRHGRARCARWTSTDAVVRQGNRNIAGPLRRAGAVLAAQALLESSTDGAATIMRLCGFGSEEKMRRIFLKLLGTTPTDYRHRFHAS